MQSVQRNESTTLGGAVRARRPRRVSRGLVGLVAMLAAIATTTVVGPQLITRAATTSLTVTIAEPAGAPVEGSELTYTATITNPGDEPVADIAVTTVSGATVSCPMTTLDPGASMDCTFTDTVAADDVAAGAIDQSVTATGNASGACSATPLTSVLGEAVIDASSPTAGYWTIPVELYAGSTLVATLNTVYEQQVKDGTPFRPPTTVLAASGDQLDFDMFNNEVKDSITDLYFELIPEPNTYIGGGTFWFNGRSAVVFQQSGGYNNPTAFGTAWDGIVQGGSMTAEGTTATPSNAVVLNADVGTVLTQNGKYYMTDQRIFAPEATAFQIDFDLGTQINGGDPTTSTISIPQYIEDPTQDVNLANEGHGIGWDLTGCPITPTAVEGTETISTAIWNPALTVDKKDPTGTLAAGETITYDIVITNTGNVDLINVLLDDPLTADADETCPRTDIAAGFSIVCTVTYDVTQADVDAGSITNVANVTSDLPDGSTGPTGTDVVTTPFPEAPAISVVKSASPDGVGLGGTIDYTITVTNIGDVSLDPITVDDPLTADEKCPKGPLAPGASVDCTATYVVTQDDVDAGKIDNTATATGVSPAGTEVTADDSVTYPIVQNPDLALVKTGQFLDANKDGLPQVGESILYTMTVTNTGNTAIDNIVVSDPTVGDPTCGKDMLAPGDLTTCTIVYFLTQADIDAGKVDNTATVEGTDPTGKPVTDEGSTTTPLAQNPDLAVTKSTKDTMSTVGDTIDYDIVVVNTGNVTISDIEIDDPLTADEACPKTELAAGESMTCTASYVVTTDDLDAGTLTNVATVTGTAPNGDPVEGTGEITTPFDQLPAMTVTKVGVPNDDDGVLTAGETITYTVTVTNTGNLTITNLAVADPTAGTPTCDTTTLAPGAVATCTVDYTLTQADVDAGFVDNTATATGATEAGDLEGEDSTTVDIPADPALTTVKTSVVNDDLTTNGRPDAGETIDYTITVTNDGNVTLSGVELTDELLGAVTCDPALPADLAPGDFSTCTGSHTLTQADVDAGEVTNVAVATGTDPGDNELTGTDEVTDELAAEPSITVVKSAGAGALVVGDTVKYTIVVTNTGNVTVSDLQIDDSLTADEKCPTDVLAPAATMSCTASYVITQADVDSGRITNTATVTGVGPDGTEVTDDDTVNFPFTPAPKLAVTKTGALQGGGSDGSFVGDKIAYTITVTNTGNVTANNIVVDDPLTGPPTCDKTALAPKEKAICTVAYTVTAADGTAGKVLNTVKVTSDETPTPATASVTNPLPAAIDDSETGVTNQPTTVDVLANDTGDLDPSTLKLVNADGKKVTKLTVPGEGTWRVVGGKLVFTPETGFTGQATPVDYAVSDTDGNEVRAKATVTYPAILPPSTTTTLAPITNIPSAGAAIIWPALAATGMLMLGIGLLVAARRRYRVAAAKDPFNFPHW